MSRRLNLLKKARQPLTYAVIGVVNTAIHLLVFLFVIELGCTQALSNVFAFLAAVTVSYLLNARFTFRTSLKFNRYCRMALIMAVFSYLFGFIGDTYQFNPILTFFVYCLINPILGFVVSKYFVFSK